MVGRRSKVATPEWINQQIGERKRLRMLVPRLYGLGDLSEILDDRAYTQATKLLASLQEDLSKLVVTGAYRRAAIALEDHGFVILIGEPAAGKTTIAASLAMAALDQWDCSIFKVTEPAEMRDHWNPHDPRQFFWIDDAFGGMQYEAHLAFAWNRIFPHVVCAIRCGAKVVMTSRDYIYKAARRDLKATAFTLIQERQIVIDVRELTIDERERILYNHLKLGQQPRAFRSEIKPYLQDVARHQRFAPEIARRLAHPLFTRNLILTRVGLHDFVERREHLLQEVLSGLDKDSRAALGLIYMGGGELPSPIVLDQRRAGALDRLDSTLGRCTSALEALDNSLARHVVRGGEGLWIFKHPTIGDAYAGLLLANPELMGIYLAGTPVDKLLNQVTCGDVGLKGAIVVPKSLFGLFLDRLLENPLRDDHWRTDLFLATRCDRAFLSLYLQKQPQLLDRVKRPGLRLDAVGEVQIALRLHELKLLPNDARQCFISAVTEYAISGEDGYLIYHDPLRKMLSRQEETEMRARLRSELIPRLNNARHYWQDGYESEDDPTDHVSGFTDLLRALKTEFEGDEEIAQKVQYQEQMMEAWISDQVSEGAESEDYGELVRERGSSGRSLSSSERSIFDDVDQ